MQTPVESNDTMLMDELTAIELRIAQRADQLRQGQSCVDQLSACWLQAESEVWSAQFGMAEPPAGGPL